MLKKLKLNNSRKATKCNTPQNVCFSIGNWDAKVGSKDILGVTVKFGLGVQNEARQRLIEFFQENSVVIANILFQKHKR